MDRVQARIEARQVGPAVAAVDGVGLPVADVDRVATRRRGRCVSPPAPETLTSSEIGGPLSPTARSSDEPVPSAKFTSVTPAIGQLTVLGSVVVVHPAEGVGDGARVEQELAGADAVADDAARRRRRCRGALPQSGRRRQLRQAPPWRRGPRRRANGRDADNAPRRPPISSGREAGCAPGCAPGRQSDPPVSHAGVVHRSASERAAGGVSHAGQTRSASRRVSAKVSGGGQSLGAESSQHGLPSAVDPVADGPGDRERQARGVALRAARTVASVPPGASRLRIRSNAAGASR